jgi:multiple sugar transport system ATP-binding protein
MIYVTHDQAEAMTLATRIVVMQGGRIQQIGTPCEVYERPANRFVAGFLGSPSMNFIDGEVDIHGRFRAGAITLGPTASGAMPGAMTLGARPEHLHIRDDGPLEALITLVEPMGNHQVVWLDCGGHALSALVYEPRPLAAGQRVRFAIDAARVSLFDPGSGRSLP